MISDDDLSFFDELIRKAKKVVVFSGAGISTESGIPDFRGPNGIWKTTQPIDFSDFVASEEMRRESWRRKFKRGDAAVLGRMESAKPNVGHEVVKLLDDTGKLLSIITQNVDGLHQKSGVGDDMIIEIHGNANYAKCLTCSCRYELDWIEAQFSNDETLPICVNDGCRGMIKTATISFGQAMPIEKMAQAEKVTLNCDLFIVIGSSLLVYPAAGLPAIAKRCGAKLVILNNDATELDHMADLVLPHSIGETLSLLSFSQSEP